MRSTTRRKGKASSPRLLLLPAAIAALGLLLSAGAAFAQPAPAASGRPKILQWEKYQQDVIARERQEHAQRVEAHNAAANAKKAGETRRLQAEKDEAARRQAEADRRALDKKRAAQAYEKSVVQRETNEHARRIAMVPAKLPVKPPVAVTPRPKPPVTPPVAVAPKPPVTPPAAAVLPAGRTAYETRVKNGEIQEHARRVESQSAAANTKNAGDARRLQAEKDEAARRKEKADWEALNKKRAAQAYEKSAIQREADEHARRIAMAPKPAAKPPVAPPVAVAPKPKPPVTPPVTPPVQPPVAVAPTTPVTPAPPKPVAPPVAVVPPAQHPAYESGMKTTESQQHAQRLEAENQKKAELAKHQKEIAQRENTVKAREIEEHRRREEARKAADAARKAALFDFGM